MNVLALVGALSAVIVLGVVRYLARGGHIARGEFDKTSRIVWGSLLLVAIVVVVAMVMLIRFEYKSSY